MYQHILKICSGACLKNPPQSGACRLLEWFSKHALTSKRSKPLSSLLLCNLWVNYSKQISICKSKISTIFLHSFYFFVYFSVFDHIAHVVSASWLSRKELGSFHCTFAKNSLGICSMLKFDHFIRASKDHFMLAYNSTTAHCGNTDFLGVTLLSSLAAVIYIMMWCFSTISISKPAPAKTLAAS